MNLFNDYALGHASDYKLFFNTLHMTRINLPICFALFLLIACTDLHLRRQSKSSYSIVSDKIGTRWIDVKHGDCTVRVLSFQQGHLRFAVESGTTENTVCEPGVSPLIEVIAPAANALLSSHSTPLTRLQMDVNLLSQPTLVVGWAAYLKDSAQWKNRVHQKDPWGTKEYPLVKTLLEASRVFDSYDALFRQFPNLKFHALYIEKVSYQTAGTLSYYESRLRPLGYMPQERIPVPLIVSLELK